METQKRVVYGNGHIQELGNMSEDCAMALFTLVKASNESFANGSVLESFDIVGNVWQWDCIDCADDLIGVAK